MKDGTRSTTAPARDQVIHLEAWLPLSAENAYAFFVREELLRAWLTVEASVEPEEGGKYELFWEPSDRENNSTIGCRITAMAPGQLVAFQWRSPRQFKPFANAADPLTHVVVTFVTEGAGTRMHLVHSGWRSTPEWEEARVWQERAWSGALRKLEQIASDEAADRSRADLSV